MSKKIAIIGHFGGDESILDGQTIKTKILYEELEKSAHWEIVKIDTYYKSKNPIKLMVDTLVCLITCRDIIILLSRNGMKFYFPLLSFFARKFHTRVYHDVIGGNLDKYVELYPKFKTYLNSFVVNWVETASLKNKLEDRGVNNCEVIPNFKRLNIVKIKEDKFKEPYRFCMFSRVMKEKGIEDAIDAVQAINHEAEREICQLDIFGRVDDGYKEQFREIMEQAGFAIQYKGMVSYDKSVEAIMNYYALLFPTYWDGEGFPGTIVDAFSAGIPVIATDWNCNGEIVENKKTGILYPNCEIRNLKEAIVWAIQHQNEIYSFKENCVVEAERYQPDQYITKIVRKIIGEKL